MSTYKGHKKEKPRVVSPTGTHSSQMSLIRLFHTAANDNNISFKYWATRVIPLALFFAIATMFLR